MGRIVYLFFPRGGAQGGVKMAVRHVETLRELGFDAVCQIDRDGRIGDWLQHRAPVLVSEPLRDDDILVLPEDAVTALRQVAGTAHRKVIFCQGQLRLAEFGAAALDTFPADNPPTIITVGNLAAATIRRLYPTCPIEIVPCFVDERRFAPGEAKARAIAFEPKKRMPEARMIHALFTRLHVREADRAWTELVNMSEAQVAQALAASDLYLALPRFESVGLASLEAMASGCVVAGFTGIGGRDYATPDNGFWVPDDDVEAAADALAQAADLVRTGGVSLAARVEAGRETAANWSYARFRQALEEVWTRLAPAARVGNGPLAPGDGC